MKFGKRAGSYPPEVELALLKQIETYGMTTRLVWEHTASLKVICFNGHHRLSACLEQKRDSRSPSAVSRSILFHLYPPPHATQSL